MSYFHVCIFDCIYHNNNILLNILKDEITIYGPGEDEYTYNFLIWLYDNLGYFDIERSDFTIQKKHIKRLIQIYDTF